ncbi:cyclic GMP-AMP synthase DncV-like nucleotidyltransferase [Sphingomonas sp. S17]|uniref:cyclic GMP-AMP synthase DncV-like nucleotidyltransferase n=1 Tax=Sphingomonas sp. S17 TaxID=1007104 RepID=UPI000569672B|nr:hypothetical protein [Sphingomonas sp. S17]
MYDCDKDVCAYHKDEVTLPKTDQDSMRSRRDANRKRLRDGLSKANDPAPSEFVKQGSYAMKTMLRDAANDYDIDDGVYFWKEDLVGDRGAEKTSIQARWMVRDAIDDGSFKTAPEVRSNCVRVFYEKGYHVDVPVYRKSEDDDGNMVHELASSSGWKRSDARDVTQWFEDERSNSTNGTQLRRLVRLIKKYAKSRSSWKGGILSGFGITVLVTECQRIDSREDQALYDTMKAIRDRLNWNLVVKHPVTPNDTITSGDNDAKARMLRDKLTQALDWLAPLFEWDCTREKALGCWDKVFNTTYFSERGEEEARAAASYAAPIATSAALIGLESRTSASVLTSGGGRHA